MEQNPWLSRIRAVRAVIVPEKGNVARTQQLQALPGSQEISVIPTRSECPKKQLSGVLEKLRDKTRDFSDSAL